MKKSYKMKRSIDRLIRKYGFKENEISYGYEAIKENRHGKGYYDYAILACKTTRLFFIVAFDGTINRC